MAGFFKWVDSVRSDIKFRGAGEGHRLNESPPAGSAGAASTAPGAPAPRPAAAAPPPAVERAGQAALTRLDKDKDARKPVSPKVFSTPVTPVPDPSPPQPARAPAPSAAAAAEVAETTEATEADEVQPWNDTARFAGLDPLHAAIGRLRSFGLEGTAEQARQYEACKGIMLKYLDNIQAHPTEEKYRRIRKGNAVFQDRVASVPGAVEALMAVGFGEAMLAGDAAGAEPEPFLLYADEADALTAFKQLLQQTVEFNHDVRVFAPSTGPIVLPTLPDDYYNVARDELLADLHQRQRQNELDRTLRTRAMRERDQGRASRPKRALITCIRVRFPDGHLLQARFATRETVGAVYAFVKQSLEDPDGAFTLVDAQGTRLDSASTETLLAAHLTPAALLHIAAVPPSPAPRLSSVLLAVEEPLGS